ncbi:malto-oligosyltrehalose synthase [Streptomyces albus subsp. chlorinus]|uniref:malto-oligosyltrehalose synthase n=1 Tax=Streptomyces albus TaxID=1888 RepID=UPI00156F4014|nr:malto-oligosyltrehalose synthase [Streptomyces albus]NSC24477.1 malto-oligosyltrehalose synthase [Streptomyces albus subsp. chlorinus]
MTAHGAPTATATASGPVPVAAPTATYRLQLQPDFPFAAAEEAVGRLARLGVSHLHLSPVLTSVPGSTHGYDVTDHGRVREELGGERGLRALSATARAHGLGLILDIVPNHMAVPADLRLNRPLWEVLREGRGSPWARWFDIDWESGDGRVLLPVLGERLPEALPRLRVEDGTLRYHDHVLPLRAGTEALPLPGLCAAQHYRLAWWRLARSELNYRRFFTIPGLIGVRVEDPEVFAATHRKVLQLLRERVVDGLRVDHPDGLADPGGYLRRLHRESGGRWTVVEKILAVGEPLPGTWPVAGTTGYDALHHVDGLFLDPAGHARLADAYRAFTGAAPDEGGDWEATRRRAAHHVVSHDLAAELERLTRAAVRACAASPDLSLRDHAPWALRDALREMLVRLPVYRPYTAYRSPGAPRDAALLQEAAEGARAVFRLPEEATAVDAVLRLALGTVPAARPEPAACPGHPAPGRDDVREFPARFAQLSSALRAKSEEDAAFYRYVPLLSACEVGGDPGHPAVSPEDFHTYCARLQRDRPLTGTALSTHDTKRSGDARAALAVLTECPERWAALMDRTGAEGAPDRHTAWVYRQTALALGAFPPPPERLVPALLKAVREAGLHTTWTETDTAYEAAVERYVTAERDSAGSRELASFARELAPHLRADVLGAALLHLTMPGVPDLYQGTERTYRALVDPDNRNPPVLGGGGDALDEEKARLTSAVLRLRARHPGLFTGHGATYRPLHAEGGAAGHCVAFVRTGRALTAVTRLSLLLEERGGWGGTALTLPEGTWYDAPPTGAPTRALAGTLPVSELFANAPVALLVRESAQDVSP